LVLQLVLAAQTTYINTGTNITKTNGNFTASNIEYWWSVNLTDGEDGWNNNTYHFTTQTIATSVDEITPYDITTSTKAIAATGDTCLNNLTLWYTYSSDNATWWNSSWAYRKKITIESDQVGGDLTNFPVLVSITDANLSSNAQSDGDDIVFTNATGTKLNHEIENYTSATGVLVAWVNVTSLSSSTDTNIYMYYGNITCSSQQNPTGTWDSDYVLVLHFNESTGTYLDSTINNNDASAGNIDVTTRNATGKIGKCPEFDGASNGNEIIIGDAPSLDITDYTLETWMNADDTDAWRTVSAKGSVQTAFNWYWPFFEKHLYIDNGNTADRSISSTTYAENTWIYISTTVDSGTKLGLYLNATEVAYGTGPGGSATDTNAADLLIGGNAVWDEHFDGHLDEFRVSKIVRSIDWMGATYNTTNSPGTFISTSTEEVWVSWDDGSNPDTASPWQWTFDFPEYTTTTL